MKIVKKLDKITGIITKAFALIACVALLFIVAIIIVNIVGRSMGKAVIGVEEYFSMAEVVLIALALGYTQHQRGLVHVGFFMKKLPKLGPVITWAINQWVGVAIVAALVWQTLERIPNVTQVTTALRIPLKPFYMVVAVGFVIYLIAQLYEAIKSTVAIFNKEVREDVVSNFPA